MILHMFNVMYGPTAWEQKALLRTRKFLNDVNDDELVLSAFRVALEIYIERERDRERERERERRYLHYSTIIIFMN